MEREIHIYVCDSSLIISAALLWLHYGLLGIDNINLLNASNWIITVNHISTTMPTFVLEKKRHYNNV